MGTLSLHTPLLLILTSFRPDVHSEEIKHEWVGEEGKETDAAQEFG